MPRFCLYHCDNRQNARIVVRNRHDYSGGGTDSAVAERQRALSREIVSMDIQVALDVAA